MAMKLLNRDKMEGEGVPGKTVGYEFVKCKNL